MTWLLKHIRSQNTRGKSIQLTKDFKAKSKTMRCAPYYVQKAEIYTCSRNAPPEQRPDLGSDI